MFPKSPNVESDKVRVTPPETPAEKPAETPESRAARNETRLKALKQGAKERATATAEYNAIGDARRAKSLKLKSLRLLKLANDRANASEKT